MRIDWNCSEFHRISVEFELIVVKSYHMNKHIKQVYQLFKGRGEYEE